MRLHFIHAGQASLSTSQHLRGGVGVAAAQDGCHCRCLQAHAKILHGPPGEIRLKKRRYKLPLTPKDTEKSLPHLGGCSCRAAAVGLGGGLRVGAGAAAAATAQAALDGGARGHGRCKGVCRRAAALRLRQRLCVCRACRHSGHVACMQECRMAQKTCPSNIK